MSKKVFAVGQAREAVDFLHFCNGRFTLTLKGKRHWSEFSDCDIHKALEKERMVEYVTAAVNMNVSRYGHKEEDIKIVVEEPGIDEMLEDF